MRELIAEHINTLSPYVPGKPIEELERELGITGAIKLASNENPLGPSPKAIEAMCRAAASSHIYPDGSAHALREAIAAHTGQPAAEIVVGNGSNELLTLLARTFCLPGDHAVISDYAFIAYRVILQAEGMSWTSAPTLSRYATDVDALLDAVRPETRLMFIANPNNPTGTHLPGIALRRLLHAVPEHVIVVLDEAYHEYVQAPDYDTALTMRGLRERLVITRTFSKVYGMGGVRLGFAVMPAPMADYMNRVREPFNTSLMAQAGGIAALSDEDFVQRTVSTNAQGMATLCAGLDALATHGVSYIPSAANFLLIQTPHPGHAVYEGMLRQGVIVRPMGGYGLPQSLRITVGTTEQCARCLEALATVLNWLATGAARA